MTCQQHNTTQHRNATQQTIHNQTQRNNRTQRNDTHNITKQNATQRNATQRRQKIPTEHNATQRNATQRNATQGSQQKTTQPVKRQNNASNTILNTRQEQHKARRSNNTQLIATQHNATQPAQHDKTPDRYEIDGRAGRSTKNSTEKFGQKTLQAVDKCNQEKLYFDPFVLEEHAVTMDTDQELMHNIQRICEMIDSKVLWNSLTWPCREPRHYSQQDLHNCGIIICWFARCLAEGLCFTSPCNLHQERQHICDTILGFCYSDIQRRNVEVCKVCRGGDGILWVSCDACGQFFHAACIKQDYYIAAIKPFFTCPQ